MSLLYYLKRLYSLDTLDTRFTTSSKTPLQYTASEHGVDSSQPAAGTAKSNDKKYSISAVPGARPSRWNTVEYYFYYFCFITIVPMMFKVPYDVSKCKQGACLPVGVEPYLRCSFSFRFTISQVRTFAV